MRNKKPELPGKLLPCPFCGDEPTVCWNGAMTIKCVNPDCCHPRTGWYYDVGVCVEQWNRRFK